MKKLLEILRLHYECKLSGRDIEKVIKISRKTASHYIRLFANSGLPWPLPEEYHNEDKLSQHLDQNYQPTTTKALPLIDFAEIHKELRKHKRLTLQLLWEEYRESARISCSYSNFTYRYRKWLKAQPSYMRQVHKSGDKVFVDYSGDKVKIIDTDTGELREVEIFIGVLGASKYIYAEATWSQKLCDWTMSHVRMFEAFGGSPKLVISDNLRSAVSKSDRYDPVITPAYYHMLAHYGVAAMPGRIYHPKDKPDAEGGVLLVQRWILAKIRHEQFMGLSALNNRLLELTAFANNKKFKLYPENRLELFLELDKPYLRPLPPERFVYREYAKVRVMGDYHVRLDRHCYSVPYRLIGCELDLWYSASMVECYYKNECVAKHIKSNDPRGATTNTDHMPRAHQEYASLTVDKMRSWAEAIGTATLDMVELIIKSAPHAEIACKRSHGFLNLSKKYSRPQLEDACNHALRNGIRDYEYIEAIIKHEATKAIRAPETTAIPLHENIRGSERYH